MVKDKRTRDEAHQRSSRELNQPEAFSSEKLNNRQAIRVSRNEHMHTAFCISTMQKARGLISPPASPYGALVRRASYTGNGFRSVKLLSWCQ